MVQRAGPEPVGGFFQRAVGGLTDDAVHQQAAMLLEGTDRLVELRVEQLKGDVTARRQVFFLMIQHP
ncbi:Uncharacterised protein [Mycobacterium tuberculosis]|nr:Uncharacterised protein [Mycobacterium tuberculosis]